MVNQKSDPSNKHRAKPGSPVTPSGSQSIPNTDVVKAKKVSIVDYILILDCAEEMRVYTAVSRASEINYNA